VLHDGFLALQLAMAVAVFETRLPTDLMAFGYFFFR